MIPEFLFIAAALVVGLAAFAVLRQDKAAFASNLKSRIAALQVHVKQREAVLEGTGKIQSRYLFLKQSCQELTQKENRLKEDIALLEPRAGDAETKLASLAEEKSQLEAHLQTLEQDKRLWEDRIKELDRMDELVGESVKKQKELELQITETEQKIGQFAEKLKEAEAAESKLTELKEELAKAEEARAALTVEAESLRAEMGALAEEIEAGKKELEKLQNKIETQQTLSATLDATLGVNGASKALTEATFKTLFEPEFSPSSGQLDSSNPDDRFRGLKKHLKEHDYEFPERLLNAFHTSLKVQDVSCLTVMAGISGTGKSALPRLYADYMGLHSLLMPVEPRWDSPQDLFGFLNYMENRYEATPLGRSLHQFNIRDKAEKDPMQDEILMVLLDEMNLARVEYYFSEFLSRLETRRDADWMNNPEDYQKVSLEIFAGEEQEDGKRVAPIRLFAGPNILFVGTMNEDESTQSLTDKVIDRSNAIHFGRPQTLLARRGRKVSGTGKKISFKAWSKNVRKGLTQGSTQESIVSGFLNELNEHFNEIGRPFGHRSYLASSVYIANHPGGVPQRIQDMTALADQVAMRFLPKLRGVDLQEHAPALSKVKALLSTLDDDVIIKAFDNAADINRGYFQWRGINWDA